MTSSRCVTPMAMSFASQARDKQERRPSDMALRCVAQDAGGRRGTQVQCQTVPRVDWLLHAENLSGHGYVTKRPTHYEEEGLAGPSS